MESKDSPFDSDGSLIWNTEKKEQLPIIVINSQIGNSALNNAISRSVINTKLPGKTICRILPFSEKFYADNLSVAPTVYDDPKPSSSNTPITRELMSQEEILDIIQKNALSETYIVLP